MIALDRPVILPGSDRPRQLLCLYRAEPADEWTGYLVGPRGWDGRGVLPCVPAHSELAAMLLWNRQTERRRRLAEGEQAG